MEEGRPHHQVPAVHIAKHHNQTVFFAAPGLQQGSGHRCFSPCCACVVKRDPGELYSSVPVEAMPVKRILAHWRRWQGEWSQLPKEEVVLVTSLVIWLWLFPCSYTTVRYILIYGHAVLGGGGPTWPPLNNAIATSLW
jgi:hypothetical protein